MYTANTQAFAFYKALGFEEISRRPSDDQGLPFENAQTGSDGLIFQHVDSVQARRNETCGLFFGLGIATSASTTPADDGGADPRRPARSFGRHPLRVDLCVIAGAAS